MPNYEQLSTSELALWQAKKANKIIKLVDKLAEQPEWEEHLGGRWLNTPHKKVPVHKQLFHIYDGRDHNWPPEFGPRTLAVKWLNSAGGRETMDVVFDAPDDISIRAGHMHPRHWMGAEPLLSGFESDWETAWVPLEHYTGRNIVLDGIHRVKDFVKQQKI